MVELNSDRYIYKLQALANVMTNVTNINGKNFNVWSENIAKATDSLRPDIVRLTNGEVRPTGEGTATWDHANNISMRPFSKQQSKQRERLLW